MLQRVSPQRLLKFKLQNGEMDTRGSHRQTHIDVFADTNTSFFLIGLASTEIADCRLIKKPLIGPINRPADQLVDRCFL